MFEDEQKARGVSLFVELASGSASFADVVSARYAEWRNLFRILKELKADETSALRSVSLDASAPTDFGNWGRERQPMFADEFGKFLAHEGCVEAVAEDLDARDAFEAAQRCAAPADRAGVGTEERPKLRELSKRGQNDRRRRREEERNHPSHMCFTPRLQYGTGATRSYAKLRSSQARGAAPADLVALRSTPKPAEKRGNSRFLGGSRVYRPASNPRFL